MIDSPPVLPDVEAKPTVDVPQGFLFVVGAPRSGTTLLQSLLACHPDVYTAPETFLFSKAIRSLGHVRSLPPLIKFGLRPSYTVAQAQELLRRIANVVEKPLAISDDAFAGLSAEIPFRTISELLFNQFNTKQKKIFLEKTPSHIFYIDEIQELFPEARFIHIVRDPRDVIVSFNRMLGMQGKARRSVFELTKLWLDHVHAGERHGLYAIRYEDLVEAPEQMLEEVFRSLSLSFDQSYLKAYDQVLLESIPDSKSWRRGNGPNNEIKQVNNQSVHNYRKHLTSQQIKQVESLTASEMKRFGYTPDEQADASGEGGGSVLLDRFFYYAMRLKSLKVYNG